MRAKGSVIITREEAVAAQHFAMLNAMTMAVETFVAADEGSFDEIAAKGLRPLAEAASIDRVGIYQMVDVDGTPHFSQVWGREMITVTTGTENSCTYSDICK
jgi:DNA-binding phage protein